MPNGAVHHALWKMGWALSIPVSGVLIFVHPYIGIGTLLGYFQGQFIEPDLDLIGITSSEGRAMRKMPWIIGGLFVTYWTMYGYLFRGKHRSFGSHSIFFSTMLRFLYAYWWLLWLIHSRDWWDVWVFHILLGVFIGLFFSDVLHILADMFEKVIKGK